MATDQTISISTAITPLILTFNEEPNIERTLASLRWARRVVILDSGSTDQTETIARSFDNVSWHVRRFDNHCAQWDFGIRQTGIASDYVLALDADMATPQAFCDELQNDFLPGQYTGGITPFTYHMFGRPMTGSIYPAQLRVFRPGAVKVTQHGHTQVFSQETAAYQFKAPLIHDDRKPLERWVSSQLSYSRLEAQRLAAESSSRWRDRLRRWGIMPPVVGALAYLRAGGPLGGAAAKRYAYERATFECLLAIRLISAEAKELPHRND